MYSSAPAGMCHKHGGGAAAGHCRQCLEYTLHNHSRRKLGAKHVPPALLLLPKATSSTARALRKEARNLWASYACAHRAIGRVQPHSYVSAGAARPCCILHATWARGGGARRDARRKRVHPARLLGPLQLQARAGHREACWKNQNARSPSHTPVLSGCPISPKPHQPSSSMGLR